MRLLKADAMRAGSARVGCARGDSLFKQWQLLVSEALPRFRRHDLDHGMGHGTEKLRPPNGVDVTSYFY